MSTSKVPLNFQCLLDEFSQRIQFTKPISELHKRKDYFPTEKHEVQPIQFVSDSLIKIYFSEASYYKTVFFQIFDHIIFLIYRKRKRKCLIFRLEPISLCYTSCVYFCL